MQYYAVPLPRFYLQKLSLLVELENKEKALSLTQKRRIEKNTNRLSFPASQILSHGHIVSPLFTTFSVFLLCLLYLITIPLY